MFLKITIKNVKLINGIIVELPLNRGLYAITGFNGTGKSTLMTCASLAFYNRDNQLADYFGDADENSEICFEYDGSNKRFWFNKKTEKWNYDKDNSFNLKGFYEGSLIYGNRFRNNDMRTLRKLSSININQLKIDKWNMKTSLGEILHDDPNYYEELYIVKKEYAQYELGLNGEVFCYKKNDKIINQFMMSTGENLLIKILNSLNKRLYSSDSTYPKLILLDEIELALHPSALLRLLKFIQKNAERYNLAVYFSTHSIELINSIQPERIYFLERYLDNTLSIRNPSYPAYVTRNLYAPVGYDKIILVEDELAKELIDSLIDTNQLRSGKLVYVLPCGGYTNVIKFAYEVVKNRVMPSISAIIIILDADVNIESKKFIEKNSYGGGIPMNFLPIKSLEKYLKHHLFDEVNTELYEYLQDTVFTYISLNFIVTDYKNKKLYLDDNNGKKLFRILENELDKLNKTKSFLVEKVLSFLLKTQKEDVEKLSMFLHKQLK